MTSQTAAGSTLAISAAAPATPDAAGFAALTFTDIGQIEKIGTLGATYGVVEFQPLNGPKQTFKGPVDFGGLEPSLAVDSSDAGQALLRASSADKTQKLYSFRATLQDGSKFYCQGRTFGMPRTVDGAGSMVMAAPNIRICTDPVEISAT